MNTLTNLILKAMFLAAVLVTAARMVLKVIFVPGRTQHDELKAATQLSLTLKDQVLSLHEQADEVGDDLTASGRGATVTRLSQQG